MNLFLDVETIPNTDPQAKDDIRASIKPPGTLKKADSIAAWWANEADTAVEAEWRKQALDGGTHGELLSIAVCDDTGREWVRCRQHGDGVAELLREFFATVESWTTADAQQMLPGRPDLFPIDDHHVVAHNAAFDIGFLWRRSRVHGVPTPPWLPGPMARAGKDYTCTMQAWAGYSGRVSLDTLCKVLCVPSPKAGDITGAGVLDAWMAGRHADIAAYNLADAHAVRAVFHRLMGWRA